jgi:hypothetical protein
MTTADIEAKADPGNLASPDLDLKFELRQNVVPYFYSPENPRDELGGGAGYAWWRRKAASAGINQGDQSFALPADFWEMKFISFGEVTTASSSLDFDRDELKYIGEDPGLVARAEVATVQVRPQGYYYSGNPGAMLLKFDSLADQPYSVGYSYYNRLVFADNTTTVDLNDFIPNQWQWALVSLLRRVLYGFRLGVEDSRFQWATDEAKRWLQAARTNQEASNQGKRPRFVR